VLRRLSRDEFQATLGAVFPDSEFPGLSTAWQSSLPADVISPYGFDNDSAAVVGPQYAQNLLDSATSLATAIIANTAPTLTCLTGTIDAACATQFITKYGKRLFHRSLTSDEQTRYVTFFTNSVAKEDAKSALKWTIIGLIQSPLTVYRSEIGTVASDGTRHLTPTEIAAELAYTYTGRPPADALIAAAESTGVPNTVAWAKAALQTTAGQQALQHFFEGYVAYTQVLSIEKANVASFDSVKQDMVTETKNFITNVVLKPKSGTTGGISDLLTSSTTWVSPALASYYGSGNGGAAFPMPGSDGSVQRPAGEGIGLLAQGSFLATNAGPDSSSPTHRGLFVFQRLLCETKHPPPANVPPVDPPKPGVVSTRQRYETHDNMGCTTGCHNFFDPIGFGFENFDEGGRFRSFEGATPPGLPVNADSNVPNPSTNPKGSGNMFHFHDQEELVQGLVKQELVSQCFAAYIATYAFGTGESCLGSAQVPDFYANKIGIAELFANLASAPHFTTRSGM
jgi:hypothetical protein